MMPRAVEVEIVVPSAPMVKINNAALISEEMTPGTSHAARAKKKAKEKEALKSGCQVRSYLILFFSILYQLR